MVVIISVVIVVIVVVVVVRTWGMSEEDLAAVGMLKLGLVREEEEEEDILPLRPILRMDRWCLLRDFYATALHMSTLFLRRGQPHMSSYWLEQAKR